jgi:hypothetical protein
MYGKEDSAYLWLWVVAEYVTILGFPDFKHYKKISFGEATSC